MLPRRAAGFEPEKLGLNAANELRAFASAALGVTQQTAAAFAMARGRSISGAALTASGLLGPLTLPKSEEQAGAPRLETA